MSVIGPTRRSLLGGLGGLGLISPAAATPRASAVDRMMALQGKAVWSESIMVLYFDPALQNGISLRISRYPDSGLSWVWCHVILDGKLVSFVDHTLPARAFHNEPANPSGDYTVPGLPIKFMREGTATDTSQFVFSTDVKGYLGGEGQTGSGPVAIRISGTFRPQFLKGNSPKGRFERTGLVTARIEVNGVERRISGIGKGHEQSQDTPRFEQPFTYAMLWQPSGSLVTVKASNRHYGEYEENGQGTPVDSFQIEPWSRSRKFQLRLKGGRVINAEATTVHAFDIPIWNRTWHGHVVTADVGGTRMLGMINDWRPEDQPYGISAG
jgi:hypothetical protein